MLVKVSCVVGAKTPFQVDSFSLFGVRPSFAKLSHREQSIRKTVQRGRNKDEKHVHSNCFTVWGVW